MKKIILLFAILVVSVATTACINNFAVQELNNKAVSYMDKGDTETAICRLKSSLDLDNEIYQTHYNLALAYNNIGKYEEAIEELKKVTELKPDFYDAIYSTAVAKEALAFKIIDRIPDETGIIKDFTPEEIAEFTTKAQEVVDLYNEYLVKKIDAPDTKEINEKIEQINEKIKEFTKKYTEATEEQPKQTDNDFNDENNNISEE